MMKRYFPQFVLMAGFLVVLACVKPSENVYNAQAHLNEELPIIRKYMTEHNFRYTPDSVYNANGIYYQVINPGVRPDTGRYIYKYNTLINVKYVGKVLGSVQNFDQNDSLWLSLSNVINCWKSVVPKIQPKGRVRFISTSVQGYQDKAVGSIPANSILDFDVELLGVSER